MEITEAVSILNERFKGKDWFVRVDVNDRKPLKLIVYTKWQTGEILKEIPDRVDDYQVLVHFSYDKVEPVKLSPILQGNFPKSSEIKSNKKLEDDNLIAEFFRMKDIYGNNVVESIFYEEHDGKNCVTNLSDKFPELRNTIHLLYDRYGFDFIYNKL